MQDHEFLAEANRQFSALLKNARIESGFKGSDPLAHGLGLSISEYFMMEERPVTVPLRLLYSAFHQLGPSTLRKANLVWIQLQVLRFNSRFSS